MHCCVEIVIQNGNQDVINKFSGENFVVHNLGSPSTNVKSFGLTFLETVIRMLKDTGNNRL